MNIFSPGVKKEVLHKGYRLVRRERLPGQPVVLIGPYYGELGFECVSYQSQVRKGTRKAQSEGKHVVVAGFMGRHPMYELADEYWGTTEYQEHWGVCMDHAKRLFGTVESLNYDADDQVREELAVITPSEAAVAKAEELLRDGPIILVMPRHRGGEGCRNFNHWPDIMREISLLPGVRVMSTALTSSSYNMPGLIFLQNLVGAQNMMDLEIALHRRVVCSVSGDSGCQCVPLLSGARNLVLFSGMYPTHVNLNAAMERKFPGYCNKHICDHTNVMLLTKGVADKVVKFVSDHYEEWRRP